MKVRIELGGESFEVEWVEDEKGARAVVDGEALSVAVVRYDGGTKVTVDGEEHTIGRLDARTVELDGDTYPYRILALAGVAGALGAADEGHAIVKPPMNGKLEAIHVKKGDSVEKGDVLFVLEAMKMRNEVKAPMAGRVKAVHGSVGSTVDPGHAVVEIEAA